MMASTDSNNNDRKKEKYRHRKLRVDIAVKPAQTNNIAETSTTRSFSDFSFIIRLAEKIQTPANWIYYISSPIYSY